MGDKKEGLSILARMEEETLEEGREWTRLRLEEKLKQLARQQGELFPPEASASASDRAQNKRRTGGD